MAVGWVTALKLVPWGGVIEATPQLLQAARKLMGHKNAGIDAEAGTPTGTAPPGPVANRGAGCVDAVLRRPDNVGCAPVNGRALLDEIAAQAAIFLIATTDYSIRTSSPFH